MSTSQHDLDVIAAVLGEAASTARRAPSVLGNTYATTGVLATPRRPAEETVEGPDTGAES